MPVRMVCNVVYAHLIRAAETEEDREKFDTELYGAALTVPLIDQIGGM